jgi:hypothetical protein
MFGIGFKELLLLIGVLLAVWFGSRMLQRFEAHRGERASMHDRRRRAKAKVKAERDTPVARPVEEMAECPACGVYYARGTRPRCERADCPARG